MQRRGRPDGDRDQQAARHRGGQAEGDGRQRDHTTTTQRDPRVRRHGSRIGFLLPGSGAAANESANGAAAKPAEPGTPETITATCAQVDSPANRMSVLLIRRFRVRAPGAPPSLTCNYAPDESQNQAKLPMRRSAHRIPRFRRRRRLRIGLATTRVAELADGEGKSAAAGLAAFLGVLAGGGVHVAVLDDYLARRDHGRLEPVFTLLGLSTGLTLSSLSAARRRAVYRADVTYGSDRHVGPDYPPDGLARLPSDRVQRR